MRLARGTSNEKEEGSKGGSIAARSAAVLGSLGVGYSNIRLILCAGVAASIALVSTLKEEEVEESDEEEEEEEEVNE